MSDGLLYWTGLGQQPVKHYHDDAGFDLACSEDVAISPQKHGLIPCNIAACAEGYWFMIVGRSSARLKGLVVHPGIIDEGYTGDLFVACFNTLTNGHIMVKAGERIAQMIPFPTVHLTVLWTDRLPDSERGSNGFGSTGA